MVQTAHPATGGAVQDAIVSAVAANGTAVVKIGWTRQSTDTNAADADQVRGTGEVGRPSVVLPLIAGSTT